MINKKLFSIIIILIIIILAITISKNVIKNKKNGNNMNSQEIVDSILNINSYKAKIQVEVNSNKNKNKYILLQEYNTDNECIQEVLEPENISGIKIRKKRDSLTLENTKLNLKTIFENYKGLEDNSLDLINFIKEYKENPKAKYEDKNREIIMKTSKEKQNLYLKNKALYIDKEKVIPKKLVILDNNQNTTIIIEYMEIELN